jgi:hypothetical protein
MQYWSNWSDVSVQMHATPSPWTRGIIDKGLASRDLTVNDHISAIGDQRAGRLLGKMSEREGSNVARKNPTRREVW